MIARPAVWNRLTQVVAVGIIATLGSCAPKVPQIDDAPFLSAIGFNQPIAVTAHFDHLYDAQGRFAADDNCAYVALLAKAGYVSIVPNTAGAPWWGLRTNGGTLAGSTYTVPLAKRILENRSDEQSWTDGTAQYFSETVTYSIRYAEAINTLSDPPSPRFTLRLVLVRGSSTDPWRVFNDPTRGTQFDHRDATVALQEIAQRGRRHLTEFVRSVEVAQGQARYPKVHRGTGAD